MSLSRMLMRKKRDFVRNFDGYQQLLDGCHTCCILRPGCESTRSNAYFVAPTKFMGLIYSFVTKPPRTTGGDLNGTKWCICGYTLSSHSTEAFAMLWRLASYGGVAFHVAGATSRFTPKITQLQIPKSILSLIHTIRTCVQ